LLPISATNSGNNLLPFSATICCQCGQALTCSRKKRISTQPSGTKHYLPLLSVIKDGDDGENHFASNESASLVIVAAVVEYSTPPTFSSTIFDVVIASAVAGGDHVTIRGCHPGSESLSIQPTTNKWSCSVVNPQ